MFPKRCHYIQELQAGPYIDSYLHSECRHVPLQNTATSTDGGSLLQNMEMGNAAQWYSQDGVESSSVMPAVQDMVSAGGSPVSAPSRSKPAGMKVVAKSDTPDLSYINSDALKREKTGPEANVRPAPAPKQPPGAPQAQPSWADVGLD